MFKLISSHSSSSSTKMHAWRLYPTVTQRGLKLHYPVSNPICKGPGSFKLKQRYGYMSPDWVDDRVITVSTLDSFCEKSCRARIRPLLNLWKYLHLLLRIYLTVLYTHTCFIWFFRYVICESFDLNCDLIMHFSYLLWSNSSILTLRFVGNYY